MEDIKKRIEQLQEELVEIAQTVKGKVPELLPVTKTQPIEKILPLANMGIKDIGENRVQEIQEKYPFLYEKFRIHLIGRLQRNKVKYIIDKVYLIHSLDRISLAKEIDTQGNKHQIIMPVLVQVNVAGEEQKAGVSPKEIISFLEEIQGYKNLNVQGLMAMMPQSDNQEQLRPYFKEMNSIFKNIQTREIPNIKMNTLSMGMSGDYKVASEEGATLLRIGSKIFNE